MILYTPPSNLLFSNLTVNYYHTNQIHYTCPSSYGGGGRKWLCCLLLRSWMQNQCGESGNGWQSGLFLRVQILWKHLQSWFAYIKAGTQTTDDVCFLNSERRIKTKVFLPNLFLSSFFASWSLFTFSSYFLLSFHRNGTTSDICSLRTNIH